MAVRWTPPRQFDADLLCDRLEEIIMPAHPALKAHLSDLVCELPETVQMFSTVGLDQTHSQAERQLGRWRRNPARLLSRLTQSPTEDAALRISDESDAERLVVYQLAVLLFGERAAAWHLGPEGDVLSAFSAHHSRRTLIQQAITRATDVIAPKIRRGRGGSRHRPDLLRRRTADHLLFIYTMVTRKRPTVNVFTEGSVPEKQVSGRTVEFLDLLLTAVNLRTPRHTLRRIIDDWNRQNACFRN